MPTHAKIVEVFPDHNLGVSLLAAQATRDVVVHTGDDIFTLLVARTEPLPGSFAAYDPLVVISGLLALDDTFGGIDQKRPLRDLHAKCTQNNRGRSV